MAKRNRETSITQIEKRIKEGRGVGLGQEYIPWLLVQDVPSSGRATRIHGWKTNRIHHVHSDIERSYFYILEWSDIVTDIREQFPLLPIEETLSIAEELDIKHPTDPKSKQPIVLTTDFLVTVGNREVARTIKPSSELDSPRVIEKFEIERRYWAKRNIDWGIVTQLDIPKTLVQNIEWVHKEHNNEDVRRLGSFIVSGIEKIVLESISGSVISLAAAASVADDQLGLEAGTSLAMVRHFIATKRWSVNMEKPIIPSQPLDVISVQIDDIGNSAVGG
ncbi:TnsA endonuclease N-terminal domain-containing protein [Brevibacillus agri]|uniref:TnsA endonuclease N-terminal domain-containing protein n=1 Tax=Brevibacillus agri TaxID=51101 RepID=UPI0028681713|nr:TnsA endonuclease N-terminal domain-containing protein [Brevibacillus agri]